MLRPRYARTFTSARYLGDNMLHFVYDALDCASADADSVELLNAMRETSRLLGCSVLGELPVCFQPYGVTVVLVLAESHIAVSTWPEDRLAYIDLFTCRADVSIQCAIDPILSVLAPGTVKFQQINRSFYGRRVSVGMSGSALPGD